MGKISRLTGATTLLTREVEIASKIRLNLIRVTSLTNKKAGLMRGFLIKHFHCAGYIQPGEKKGGKFKRLAAITASLF